MMHEGGKSASSIVPEKPPNKAARAAAEVVEGRELAKGNLPEHKHAPDSESNRRAKRA
jgi:hypothetical protein